MKKMPTPELEAEARAFVQRYAKAYGLDPDKLWRDHQQKLLKRGVDWFVRTREEQEQLAADYQASRKPGRNSPPAIQWPGAETLPASAPTYQSFVEYLERTKHAERMIKCRAAAKKANRERLMSARPTRLLSGDDLWGVMIAARGRCVYCGSLAVEKRPSKPNGAPGPWAQIGRRIGSFEHCQWRARGGDNDLSNIAWACLWCNTWESERRKGATDHGGFHPPPDDPAKIGALVRQILLASLRIELKKARASENWDEWLETARVLIDFGDELEPDDRDQLSELLGGRLSNRFLVDKGISV